MGRLVQIALAESAGGAVAGIVADSVLYAIDSAKVRAQYKSVSSLSVGNISILFRGLAPTVLLGSVPVFGSFFLLYAPLRVTLHEYGYGQFLPFASAMCAIPATVVGVPADVIKKRLVLGIDPSVQAAISHVTKARGIRGLFAGWHVNLIRDLPFAAVKIGLYEWFAFEWRVLNDISIGQPIPRSGAAVCGVISGIVCAILTCPLDVVNTRIKAGNGETMSIFRVGSEILRNEGLPALFRGVGLRSAVLGIGSSIFWPIHQSVSSSLQPFDSCPLLDDENRLSLFSRP